MKALSIALCLAFLVTGCAAGSTSNRRAQNYVMSGMVAVAGAAMIGYAAKDTTDCTWPDCSVGENLGEAAGDTVLVVAGLVLVIAGVAGVIVNANAEREAQKAALASQPKPAISPPGLRPAPVPTPRSDADMHWEPSERRDCVVRTIPANPETGEGPREVLQCKKPGT